MTAAVLVHRFGPYHIARLAAVARRTTVIGVEMSKSSHTYAWDPVDTDQFRRVTLCDDDEQLPHKDLVTRLENVLNDIQPDVVYTDGWSRTVSLQAILWSHDRKAKTVVMSESSYHDEPRRIHKEWIKRQIIRGFSSAFVGGKLHRDYAHQLGMPLDRIFLGYDVVDNDYFREGADRARASAPELRKQLSLPERYFFASNRFVPKKNLSTMISAYHAYLQKAGKSAWKLVLAGDGPLKEDLKKQIESLGLPDQILLPGFKQYDDLPTYYGLASAFLHLSTTEQWGLVVNEACAAGLPVIVSKACGCVPELVHNDVNGWAVSPRDTQAIADCMRKITSDDTLARKFGQASQTIVSAYSPEHFADGFLAAGETKDRGLPWLSRLIIRNTNAS